MVPCRLGNRYCTLCPDQSHLTPTSYLDASIRFRLPPYSTYRPSMSRAHKTRFLPVNVSGAQYLGSLHANRSGVPRHALRELSVLLFIFSLVALRSIMVPLFTIQQPRFLIFEGMLTTSEITQAKESRQQRQQAALDSVYYSFLFLFQPHTNYSSTCPRDYTHPPVVDVGILTHQTVETAPSVNMRNGQFQLISFHPLTSCSSAHTHPHMPHTKWSERALITIQLPVNPGYCKR